MSNDTAREAAQLGWFHRYPARFADEVVVDLITATTDRLSGGTSILDPFAGTGSTLAAARQLGHSSIGIELSELGVLIASVRLNPPKNLEEALSTVDNWVKTATPTVARGLLPNELIDWLGSDNSEHLAFLIQRLQDVEHPSLRRWLQLAISGALRPASKWLPGSIKPQVDPARKPPCILENLSRIARQVARDSLVEGHLATAPATVMKGDATRLPLANETIDGVVTSPPYGSMYDYFDVQRLSYLAFGWPVEEHLQIGRKYRISVDGVGFVPPRALRGWYEDVWSAEDTWEGRSIRKYVQGLREHFSEVFRVVRPAGVVAYDAANSVRAGQEFDLVGAIVELLREVGFVDIEEVDRSGGARRILPAGRDPKTGRFSGSVEHIASVTQRYVFAVRP